MPSYHQRQVVKYSVVFQQEPVDVWGLLRGIDKSTVMKLIARMNHLARTKTISSVDQVLNMWFGTSNASFRQSVRQKIIAQYLATGAEIDSLTIINIWSNLTIMDILLAEPESDHPKKSGDEAERDFFRIYLSVNERFADGSVALKKQIDNLTLSKISAKSREMMTTLIKYHDFGNTSPKEVFASQVIRAYHCFRFLETSGQQKLLQKFLNAYGIVNWQEYLRLILPLCQGPLTKGDGSGLYYFQLEEGPDYNIRRQFIQRLSLSGAENYPVQPDFIHLRANPLYETEPNRFLVCDVVLNINRIQNSMLFELKTIAENNQHLHARYDNFFSFHNDEFVEKYLAYELLRDVYSKTSYYRLSGSEIKTRYHIDQEPDYYVRNGRKVFLFEVKGSMLTGVAKQSFDYEVLEAELKKKYYKKPGKNKNIGILQLIDRIRMLLPETGQVSYDQGARPKNLKIYPILLTTERALCTPGTSQLFNEWFFEAVRQDKQLAGKINQIHPLTILDVDTLINFTDIFKSKAGLFEDVLIDYHKCIKTKAFQADRSVSSDTEPTNQQMQSFPDYLNTKFHFRISSFFMEIGKNLITSET